MNMNILRRGVLLFTVSEQNIEACRDPENELGAERKDSRLYLL